MPHNKSKYEAQNLKGLPTDSQTLEGLADVQVLLDRLGEFDTRFDRLANVLADLLLAQKQIAVLLSRGTDGAGVSGTSLVAPPSQEQLGQVLSRYVLGEIDNI